MAWWDKKKKIIGMFPVTCGGEGRNQSPPSLSPYEKKKRKRNVQHETSRGSERGEDLHADYPTIS